MTTTDLTVPSWVDRSIYPFTPRTFHGADGRMSYLDEGEGPPVLLVHGTPSWSFEWREVIRLLAPHHRVIAPDHLGFGLSDKPHGAGFTPADHARRLLALVDHLDLRELTLVVHDFGGPIALPIALDRRERVSRLVVLNSWMWPNAGDPEVARVDRVVRGPLGRFLYFTLNLSPRVLLPSSLGDRRLLTKELHRHYLAPFAARSDREPLLALALALGGGDAHYVPLWERRAELRALPMAIVWGEKDPAFKAAHLARWIAAFPEAEVTPLPQVGHFPAEEAPLEVARAIARPEVRGRLASLPTRSRLASRSPAALAVALATVLLAVSIAWVAMSGW